MLTLRRNSDRLHMQRGKQDTWLTFYRNEHAAPDGDGFGALVVFNEMLLPAGEIAAQVQGTGVEIVTYVYRGVLAQEDSEGNSGVVHSGEFQRMIIGLGVRHKEKNPSSTDDAHILKMVLRSSEAGLESVREQMRFPVAQRHNLLCVIASPDGRKKSLKILQDVLIYSSILDPGHHLVHELLPGRSAWLHVIRGEAAMQEVILTEGDGVGVTVEPSVSITAQESTELLLVDSGPAEMPSGSRGQAIMGPEGGAYMQSKARGQKVRSTSPKGANIMAKIYRFVTLIILVGLLATSLGCAATQTNESTGQYIDNAAITTKVKAAIFSDETLKTFQISVESFKGEVQLSGFVNSPEAAARAGKVARNVEGVVSVNNNLIVK